MKKELLLVFTMVWLFASCSPNNPDNPNNPDDVKDTVEIVTNTPIGKILGTIIVANGSYEVVQGDTILSDFIGNNIEAELTRQKDDTTKYSITLYKVSFSNRMPVTIDMTISGVDIDLDGNMRGNEIVPTVGLLGEFPQYTIRDLIGVITFNSQGKGETLKLNMLCGEYPTSYGGVYITE